MKRAKNILALFMALLMLGTALVGCGKQEKENESVTITFSLWDEAQSVVYQELIDLFEKENPGIKVEMQLTPWAQYWTKFDAAAGANQAADVFFMNIWVPKYAEAGIMEPLDSYMERDGFDLGLYTASVVENGTYNGVHYSVPKGTDSLAVIINTAMFEKYGVTKPDYDWTWEDLTRICKELREKMDEAGDDVYPLSLILNSTNSSWQPIIYQFGGREFDENGYSDYDSPEAISAIQEIVNMIDNKWIPDYQTVTDTSGEELFISGQAAMLYLPSFSAQKIETAEMENVELIKLPTGKTENFVAGNMHYGMNSASEHKEEAWTFLKFLGSQEANDIIGKSGIDLPALVSSQQYYAGSFKQFDGSAFMDDVANAMSYQSAPAYCSDAVSSLCSDYIIKVFTKELSAEEGMKQMVQAINAEIDAGK